MVIAFFVQLDWRVEEAKPRSTRTPPAGSADGGRFRGHHDPAVPAHGRQVQSSRAGESSVPVQPSVSVRGGRTSGTDWVLIKQSARLCTRARKPLRRRPFATLTAASKYWKSLYLLMSYALCMSGPHAVSELTNSSLLPNLTINLGLLDESDQSW